MDHWMGIDITQHSLEERAEIMQTLASVMSNEHGYATMAQSVGIVYERNFSDYCLERMHCWATATNGENGAPAQLSDTAKLWWQRVAQQPASGLIELAKGHLRDVYHAPSSRQAVGAYECAIASLLRSGHGSRICEQAAQNFPSTLAGNRKPANDRAADASKDGILGLAGLFDDVPTTSTAYWRIAVVLLAKQHPGPARLTCDAGLAREPDASDSFRLLCFAAEAEFDMGRPQEAADIISERLNLLSTKDISLSMQRRAHIVKARVYARLGQRARAAEAFAAARASGKSTGTTLDEEVAIYRDANDYIGLIDTLRSWSPIERFTWLILDRSDRVRHLNLHEAAVKAGQREYLVQIYEEAIAQLDKFSAAAPLRCDLARAHLLVRRNAVDARRVLDQVLDNQLDGQAYKIAYDDRRTVLVHAVCLQSRALWDLFFVSRDPAVKSALLEAARGLMKRPLASSVSSFSTTGTLYYEIMVARMTLQMGPRVDFQTRMQRVISTCFDALEDNVSWNDCRSLWLLAQALAHLSKAVSGTRLRRAACILLSAYFSLLEPASNTGDEHVMEKSIEQRDGEGERGTGSVELPVDASTDGNGPSVTHVNSDVAQETVNERAQVIGSDDQVGSPIDAPRLPDNEGDLCGSWLICDGSICHPRVKFNEWKGRSLHGCIDCDDTALCEQCHTALQADRDGTVPFCGRGHDHIKAPVDGWRGVKNGIMRIEGEEDVPFKKFLHNVRELCDEAWDQFWQS